MYKMQGEEQANETSQQFVAIGEARQAGERDYWLERQ